MGKKVSFQVTSLIKGSSTCGAFVWRFLFRFEASKGLILHRPPGLTYLLHFFLTATHNGAFRGRTRTRGASCGRAASHLSLSCPKSLILYFSSGDVPRPWGTRTNSLRAALPLRFSRYRPGGPSAPHPTSLIPHPSCRRQGRAAARNQNRLEWKRRRGQTRRRGSLPAAKRVPAGFEPVSQGRGFPAALPRWRR